MGKQNRDDFTELIKRVLAFRANHRCSFQGCRIPTCGPSEESNGDFVNIGVAAHIHAAAPGGPRYLKAMTPSERSAVDNGIWLCQTHSRLVDGDIAAFTPDVLRAMKVAHEASVRAEFDTSRVRYSGGDFVAIGHEIIFSGELVEADGTRWSFRIDHFLVGGLPELLDFCQRFSGLAGYDRFVIVNAMGDGREVTAPPSWRRGPQGDIVSVEVSRQFPRISAHQLPRDLAVNDACDLFVEGGNVATVSGLDALPQRLRMCLSTRRGEMPFSPQYGTRIAEYFDLFRGSPWLPRLLKTEVIRMASIPYTDWVRESSHTPLLCVLRVHSIEQLDSAPTEDWIPFRMSLDVSGVGPWQHDIPVFVPRPQVVAGNEQVPRE